jgi:hypothetical protein
MRAWHDRCFVPSGRGVYVTHSWVVKLDQVTIPASGLSSSIQSRLSLRRKSSSRICLYRNMAFVRARPECGPRTDPLDATRPQGVAEFSLRILPPPDALTGWRIYTRKRDHPLRPPVSRVWSARGAPSPSALISTFRLKVPAQPVDATPTRSPLAGVSTAKSTSRASNQKEHNPG